MMNLCLIFLTSLVIITLNVILFVPAAESQTNNHHLPILLIHGYLSTSSVWNEWQELLESDGIYSEPVTFTANDMCGSSANHANQLKQIVKDFKIKTNSDKINIVAHSKGGLDARMYLAADLLNDDVANLIMIGTPNDGSPLASSTQSWPKFYKMFMCWPAIDDLAVDSEATKVPINANTNYYTIGGDWNPWSGFSNCSYVYYYWLTWGSYMIGDDDGMVPLDSAVNPDESFENIGISNNCHTNLLGEEEYNMVKDKDVL